MINPIIKNKRSLYYFLFSWLLLAVIHVFLLYYFYNIKIEIAALDGLVFNLTFCGLALNLWYVVKYIDVDSFNASTILINHVVMAVVAIAIWLSLGILIFKLLEDITGNYLAFLYQTLPARFLLGLFLYSGVILLYYSFAYYANLQEKKNKETQLQALIKEAELNVLKSQINPHFIFNSLNSISSLTILRPSEARDMIIKLSEFLRYALDQDMKQTTLLKNELENIRRYLEIEKIRFGERLVYNINIHPKCEESLLPNMILQPLLENAVKHGVHESTETVIIEILCKAENNFLNISIKNNYDAEGSTKKRSGIGLQNIQNRLSLIYGRSDLFRINNSGNKFEVFLSFPQNEPKEKMEPNLNSNLS